VTADGLLEQAILDLCRRRGAGKTICPSEAVRAAAVRLVADGRVVVSHTRVG
jgi:hypothetical protein